MWPDSFTNYFHPHIGQAAVRVLEAAGWSVTIPTEPVCCGLTWISTGQLTHARKVLGHAVVQLAGHVQRGGYVVGLEPSCTAVFRSDAPELLAGNLDVEKLRDHTVTLAELLMDHSPGWSPPELGKANGLSALAQVHCHQHAIMGWDADSRLLAQAGVDAEQLESGCCGLAGNFGFTKGHGEVSQACAERVLLPRLREADAQAVVLADGFSCRTQIHEHWTAVATRASTSPSCLPSLLDPTPRTWNQTRRARHHGTPGRAQHRRRGSAALGGVLVAVAVGG